MAWARAFLLSVLFLASMSNVAHSKIVDEEIEELQSLADSSRDGIIRLRDETYKEFAKNQDKPRKYYLIVFFDAVMLKDNHQLNLPGFKRDYTLLVKAYAESVRGKDDVVPVFFADIEYKESERTFRTEGINALPHIKLFAPGSDTKGASQDFSRFDKTFAGIIRFMKDNNIHTDDIKPPPPLTQSQMIFLGISFILLTPFFASYFFSHKTFLHDPSVWCIFGLAIYLFSVSGGMFNIIRNMPWYIPSRDKPGTFVYFLQQGGNQFGAEGLAIGAFYTAVGLLTAFNIYVLPKAKSNSVKRLVGYFSIFACAFAVRKVVDFEVWKQGYWVHGFWPNSWK